MLTLARMSEKHNGYVLVNAEGKSILYIDGNNSNPDVPVAILSIDPHVVYGMSHPAVIGKILGYRPQNLLSTKKIAHSLYEHGMKAAWGQVTFGERTVLLTTLNTFYSVISALTLGENTLINVHAYPGDDKAYLELTVGAKKYIIASTNIDPGFQDARFINLDLVRDYVVLD